MSLSFDSRNAYQVCPSCRLYRARDIHPVPGARQRYSVTFPAEQRRFDMK